MIKFWTIFLAILALGVSGLWHSGSKPADDEIQCIQLERAWNQAEVGYEPAPITSLFEVTLVYVDEDGFFS